MLKLVFFGAFIVAASAAVRDYNERYIFYFKEPVECRESGCDDKPCGANRECPKGYTGKCGNWIKGYNNYCCSVSHGTTLNSSCDDPFYAKAFASFNFDTSGTPVEEARSSCTSGGGFISEGIEDPENISCCSLDKDAFILYEGGSYPFNSEGNATKARCVDPLVPIAASRLTSSATPSSTAPTQSRSEPTGTGSPASTASGNSATSTPNAASSNQFAAFMGTLPIFGLLALYI